MKRLSLLTIATLILLLVVNVASAEFDVRIIYFKPTDAGDIDKKKHETMLKDIQRYFQSEMTRHGYEGYTFPLELDGSNNLIIHTVEGKNATKHYDRNTASEMYHNRVKPELPFAFNNDRNISSSSLSQIV